MTVKERKCEGKLPNMYISGSIAGADRNMRKYKYDLAGLSLQELIFVNEFMKSTGDAELTGKLVQEIKTGNGMDYHGRHLWNRECRFSGGKALVIMRVILKKQSQHLKMSLTVALCKNLMIQQQ